MTVLVSLSPKELTWVGGAIFSVTGLEALESCRGIGSVLVFLSEAKSLLTAVAAAFMARAFHIHCLLPPECPQGADKNHHTWGDPVVRQEQPEPQSIAVSAHRRDVTAEFRLQMGRGSTSEGHVRTDTDEKKL